MGIRETVNVTGPIGVDQPTRVRYRVLAAVCVLALIAYIHRVGFASAGTYLKQDLALDDRQWSQVMAAFLFAYAAFEVPWGLLGDRFGARHLLPLIALAWSALTAALALVVMLPTTLLGNTALLPFAFLLVLRFLFGMFQAGGFPITARVIADWIPTQERGTATGLMWTFSRTGGALAPFLMIGLITALGSWEWALVSVAALGVLWCAAVWPWFRNAPEDQKQVNAAELALIMRGRGKRSTSHEHASWARLLRSRSVWALCLMYGCCGFAANFFITLLPAYLREHRGLSAGQMTWLSGLPLAFGIVACLAGGLLSDWLIRVTGNRKWGRRLSGLIGQAGAGVALLSTNWAHEVWVLAALLSITFFFNDLAMGPAWASCADIGERDSGLVGGAMNMIGNLAGAVGTLVAGSLLGKLFIVPIEQVAGLVKDHVIAGNDLVFVVFACSYWLASLCWLGVDVTKPLSATSTAPVAEPQGN